MRDSAARFVRFQFQLWRFCARRLRENNVAAMSAALSFRTIFALIPILLFAFLVMKSIGVIEDSKRGMRQFLEVSGFSQIVAMTEDEGGGTRSADAPGARSGDVYNVAEEIEAVVADVESKLTLNRIGPIGGVLLVWTALTLLTTMERSLNRIFGARRSRAIGRRILLYWSAITLGPVALAAAAYSGGAIIQAFGQASILSRLLVAVGWAGPIVVGVLVLAAFYKWLPNTPVRFRAAVGGAVIAVPLWLAARWGFALYVQHLVVKGSLYGILGLLPLFLLWLNLSWMIFLFGAELAHTAANFDRMRSAERAERTVLGPSDLLAAGMAVARRFRSGKGPVSLDEVCALLNLPGESAQSLVERLMTAGILCGVGSAGEPRYTLARPAEKIAIAEILEIGDPRTPSQICGEDHETATAIREIRQQARTSLANRTLADIS